jgi:hypothetical protein
VGTGGFEPPTSWVRYVPAGPGRGVWAPKTTIAWWQWQLQSKIDPSIPAPTYDVDSFQTGHSTVRKLHASLISGRD